MLKLGYELFHTHEPYSANGLHTSGDGSVAMYITFNQCTDDEILDETCEFKSANFISPLLYGIRSFALGKAD
ncbi:MAG: hypothetical protein LBV17_10080 [Treponema sp.]|jgi:hypothetical protein|nr:hypothetical protein [Treponema sp.]